MPTGFNLQHKEDLDGAVVKSPGMGRLSLPTVYFFLPFLFGRKKEEEDTRLSQLERHHWLDEKFFLNHQPGLSSGYKRFPLPFLGLTV